MEHYKVENTAPPAKATGVWKDKVTSLDVGEWFIAPKRDKQSLLSAGNNYLSGKYSLYKISDNDYCFVRRA